MIPMTIFALIAALGFFHVISAETTAWGFAAWLAVMVIRASVLRETDESREEPGYSFDVPARGGQSNIALLALMRQIDARLAVGEDAMQIPAYDEPMAMYPQEMRMHD